MVLFLTRKRCEYMKNYILNNCMDIVSKNNNYDEVKLAEIKYGLEALYLQVSKLVIIAFIACILNIFKELVILLLIHNIIRATSFGLHATKSCHHCRRHRLCRR